MDWNLVSFIMASLHRKTILLILSECKVSSPSLLKNRSKLRIEHVSKVLKELTQKNLVDSLTPEARKGKLFSINALGLEIAGYIKSITTDLS